MYARESQLSPLGDWSIWLVEAGRGFGKSRTGAEWIRMWAESGKVSRMHLVARTAADVRDVMIEGESGLLNICPPWAMPKWKPSLRLLEWPNGCVAETFSADEPESLRGPQCFIAGTMVTTPSGQKPIETLKIGELVITRKGPMPILCNIKRVAEAGCVRFSNGKTLTGTREHPIMMRTGWVKLYKLKQGDKLWSGKKPDTVISPFDTGLAGERKTKRKQSISIVMFGRSILDPFQRICKSIIKMGMARTMPSRTWSWLQAKYTTNITQFQTGTNLYCQQLQPALCVGIPLLGSKNVNLLYAINANTAGLKRKEKQSGSVNIAEVNSLQEGEVSAPSVASIWQPTGRREVFNLTVADAPEYFANGILVHNCEKAWADEIGAWKYPEAWDMLMFGLRIGDNPQVVATTTPRPTKLIKEIRKLPHTVRTGGSTYENRDNLAPSFFTHIINRYEGTRLGRQEINGELLEDNPGALWNLTMIDSHRVKEAPQLRRIVVAIDPPASSKQKSTERKGDNVRESDEAGIVIAGIGVDSHGYVLADRSFIAKPEEWGKAAVVAYREFNADRIIAETNNGGEMVEYVIKSIDSSVPFKGVHASRGKMVRAEPVSALYEQGKIHHTGSFPLLEDQMCDYNPLTSTDSPDRMDALVWAFTELMFAEGMGMLDHMANQHAVMLKSMGDKGMAVFAQHKKEALEKRLEEIKKKVKGGLRNG